MNNRRSAIEGESGAAKLLEDKGFKVIERNYRTRAGEIDIIAKDGNTYVFVEVKARASAEFGAPGEMVTPAKMYKLAGAAKQWLAENGVRNKPCRFDVVTVLGEEIEHIEGAFDMDDAARGAYAVRKHRG